MTQKLEWRRKKKKETVMEIHAVGQAEDRFNYIWTSDELQ